MKIRKVRIHRFGGPEVLQLDEVESSLPDASQVLVTVKAASINPVDFKIRKGGYPAVKRRTACAYHAGTRRGRHRREVRRSGQSVQGRRRGSGHGGHRRRRIRADGRARSAGARLGNLRSSISRTLPRFPLAGYDRPGRDWSGMAS